MTDPATISASAYVANAGCACVASGPACLIVVGAVATVGIVAFAVAFVAHKKKA